MNKPFVLALIGTSGSGKTTIGTGLNDYFKSQTDIDVQLIDGDEIRKQLGGKFGYTKEERDTVRAITDVVIQYLLNHGVSVISAGVSAYEEQRQERRKLFGDKFIQCYVKCSFEECCRRDTKGYYKLYLDGKMNDFNVKDNFEEPKETEIIVDTEKLTVDDTIKVILDYIDNWEQSNE